MYNTFENKSLKAYNTFGIDAIAKNFIELNNDNDISNFIQNFKTISKPIFFLGSGANTLFTKNFEGTIVFVNNKGIEIIKENNSEVHIKVKAGEIWDDFVSYCVKNNYYGIENLVAIPGKIGAAPIQNIGAYGVEVGDAVESVYFHNLQTFKYDNINKKECRFAYRNSIFKNELKDKILITEVVFKLSKNASLKLNYGSIDSILKTRNISNPSLKEISSLIREIRESKLPKVEEIGNAGSFFKNPIISIAKLKKLQTNFPEIVYYKINNDNVKIAAGWLIDNAGLKGFTIGGASIHKKQALVIVNKNNASSDDIVKLSQHIQFQVLKTYNISISPEVIFI